MSAVECEWLPLFCDSASFFFSVSPSSPYLVFRVPCGTEEWWYLEFVNPNPLTDPVVVLCRCTWELTMVWPRVKWCVYVFMHFAGAVLLLWKDDDHREFEDEGEHHPHDGRLFEFL